MDMASGVALVGVVLSSSGGLIWAIRQEGRITGHDQKFDEREKLEEEREKRADERQATLLSRLDRIERRIGG